jgi:hypothetical protein
MIWLLIPIAIASGILGRCGGVGKPYNTRYRDAGCSLLVILAIGVLWGWQASFWWVYVLIFGLHWAAFSTYWDEVFGYDNFAFSGWMVGLALAPICIIDYGLWWVVAIRVIGLAVIWWALNKFLPKKVWIWGRDVVEEFSRYFVSL